jgi:acyl transferase domain-containing protein/SAM-dependent methyltransferase
MSSSSEIAIIGMSCRFPGAENYGQFWSNLIHGLDAIREIPSERWDPESVDSGCSRWCGLLDSIDCFDHRFFSISPPEARAMDPQQRLLLEEAWHCIEDAGISLRTLQNKTTAVLVGSMTADYQLLCRDADIPVDGFSALGNLSCMLANRISYTLGLQGPSYTLDAGCAASLVALHKARISLLAGECSYALVAGVNINCHPWKYLSFSKAHMLSPTGRCRTFDREANGYVPGDGIGVLLLQPAEQARQDRKHIYGIIKGSAVNHGGKALSVTAPRVEAQRDVILAAYREAGISPETVTYVEAHGTGTSLGDPIEMEALTRAFRQYTEKTGYCSIGSVKTNIGHLEAAAGIAGLMKVLLMLQHRQIPPSLHLDTLNPMIELEDSPFTIATKLDNWQCDGKSLQAGVSSFGLGGVNSHLLVEEAGDSVPSQTATSLKGTEFFLLSARSEDALHRLTAAWCELTTERKHLPVQDVCATLATGREHFTYRFGLLIRDTKNIREKLEGAELRTENHTLPVSFVPWCLYPGAEEWAGFEEIEPVLADEPFLRSYWEQALQILADMDAQLRADIMVSPWPDSRKQLYSFIFKYVHARAFLDLGLLPALLAGEGSGLWLSLVLSEMLRLEDALAVLSGEQATDRIQIARPALPFLDPVTQQIFMPYHVDSAYLHELLQGIEVQPEEVAYFLQQASLLREHQFTFKKYLQDWGTLLQRQIGHNLESLLQQAEHNTEEQKLLVLIIASALRQLDTKWQLTRRTQRIANPCLRELLDLISHGGMDRADALSLLLDTDAALDRMAEQVQARLGQLETGAVPSFPLLAEHTARMPVIEDFNTWLEQAREREGTVPQEMGYLAIGTTTGLPSDAILCCGSNPSQPSFREALLALWKQGADLDWACLYPEGSFTTIPLPTYPFDRQSFWPKAGSDIPSAPAIPPDSPPPSSELLSVPIWKPEPLPLPAPGDREAAVLLFTNNREEEHELLNGLQQHFQRTVLVTAGDDYEQVLTQVGAVKKIYFMPGLHHAQIDNVDALAAYENRTLMPLFRLCKVLSAHISPRKPLELIVLTRHLHRVDSEDSKGNQLYPYAAALLGTAKVLGLENPAITIRCVDLDQHTPACLGLLVQESGTAPFFQEVAYRNGTRSIKTLRRFSGDSAPIQQPVFRKKGLYLIIGGMGGIGLEVSRFLAQHFQARLVLVGRSKLNRNRKAELDALRSLGGEAEYHSTDVTDQVALSALLKHISVTYGVLNGVIHSAVVMAGGLFQQMSEDMFLQALQPKSRGSFLLGQLLDLDALDFLLFFSSIISFRGDAGASNYAAGCAFQDAYSHYLGQPVISIDWGRWDELGVTANARFRDVQGLDQAPLQSDEGLQALQEALRSQQAQMIAAKLGEDWLSPGTLVEQLKAEIRSEQLDQDLHAGIPELEEYARLVLLQAFQRMGLFLQTGETYTLTALKSHIDLLEKYSRLFDVLLDILVRAEVLRREGEQVIVKGLQATSALPEKRAALEHAFPDKQAHITLLHAGMDALADILSGQVKATDCLFPDASLSLVEGFYSGNRFAEYYNELTAWAIRHAIKARLRNIDRREPVRVLELGAGTGGTSVRVLEHIAEYADHLEYVYTDISRAFLQYGRRRFGAIYPFLSFSLLNLEGDLGQYEELGQFDIIFATNVVHATKNLGHTLSVIRQLLSPGGCLLLNELTAVQDFLSLTFGLLDGWWLFEDAALRLPHSPLLGQEQWKELLSSKGFTEIEALSHLHSFPEEQKQSLIIGYLEQQPDSSDHLPLPSVQRAEKTGAVQSSLTMQKNKTYPGFMQILEQVKVLTAQVLEVTPQDILVEEQFVDLGIDSILGVQLVNQINQHFNEHLLSTSAIFDYPSIQQLAEYIAEQFPDEETSSAIAPDAVSDVSVPGASVSDASVSHQHIYINHSTEHYGQDKSVIQRSVGLPPEGQTPPQTSSEDVAVIGLWCRYPDADSPQAFWDNLAQSRDAITDIPRERWDLNQYLDQEFKERHSSYCTRGGFLRDIDMFDPLFFNISPKEAELMDPQQRLFLECAWHALEDAGYAGRGIAEQPVGLFVGMKQADYFTRILEQGLNLDAHVFIGNDSAILASRLAYHLNLNGPAMALDTACSSSLVAIHLAAEQIRSGQVSMALAGGVLVMTTPQLFTMALHTGMLSPDGICKTFDTGADGFVPGEGVGVVVLKSLRDAVAAGDRIYGVIKGSGINQDGKTNGITAPSSLAQTRLELEVYRQAGIDPATISYVEAHGTGTKLGDPIEVEALRNAFRQYTDQTNFCAIGSVKTNIGHTMFAGGAAGFIKVLLALQHKQIPASLHFHQPNEHIDFADSPFYVPTSLQDWPETAGHPRRATVSAFGFSGTNAHVLLEEYIPPTRSPIPDEPQLILLSAKNSDRLQAQAQQLVDFLSLPQKDVSTPTSSPALSDLAYTLQTGRFALEERLAFVSADVQHLQKQLHAYLTDSANEHSTASVFYEGNTKKSSNPGTALLIEGKSGQAFLKAMTEEKELDKLARLWVAGVEVDWELLHISPVRLQRVSLPVYPFADERYWLPEDISSAHLPEGRETVHMLHPLIASNTSTLFEQKFTTILTGKEFFLSDHIIVGKKILPGVTYLEMGRVAAHIAGERVVQKITHIVWSSAIALPLESSADPVNVTVSLHPEEDSNICTYKVETYEDAQSHLHVTGKVHYAAGDQPAPEQLDIQAVKARCQDVMSAQEFYAYYRKSDADLGYSFQVVQAWWGNETECLSVIQLPEKLQSDWQKFILHPSLLDGMLQTPTVRLFRDYGITHIPFALSELEIFAPLTEKAYVYAVSAEEKNRAANAPKRFNIWLTDEAGNVLLKIKDFSSWAYRPKQSHNELKTLCYTPIWEKALREPDTRLPAVPLLLFDKDESRQHILLQQDTPVILVKPGTEYCEESPQRYVIAPDCAEDYRQLLASVQRYHSNLPLNIVHFWSQDNFVPQSDELAAQLDSSLYSLFYLIQALEKEKQTEKIQLLYCYVEPEGIPQPHYGALSGFGRTVVQEYSKLLYKTIALPSADVFTTALPGELSFQDGMDIRYVNHQERRVRRWQQIDWEKSAKAHIVPLKKEGVYIITGGLGGLGLIFSEYLAKQVNARLFLMGRSALNEAGRAKIQALTASGASVVYRQMDVADPDEVNNAVREATSEFGEINGIIHAAGILQDALVLNKTSQEIDAVLAPKVFGTLHLDEATKQEPLDFFVLFSGVAGAVGNTGQSDYAYANSFLDHFSGWRTRLTAAGQRAGKTLSINWPLWKDGGMQVNEHTRQWLANNMGMVALPSEQGLEAFTRSLSLSPEQLMLIYGQASKIESFLRAEEGTEINVPEIPPVKSNETLTQEASISSSTKDDGDDGDEKEAVLDKIQTDVLRVAAEIVRMETKLINVDTDITDYGFDSISFTDLSNRLNTLFHLDVTPAIFFEYPSVHAVTDYLYSEYKTDLAVHYQDDLPKKTQPLPTQPVEPTTPTTTSISAPEWSGPGAEEENRTRRNRLTPTDRRSSTLISPSEPLKNDTSIAIIGMSGVMPESPDLESFWQNLLAGNDLIREVPPERWDWQEYYGDPIKDGNKTRAKWGGFMPDLDKFDAGFFNISAREAELMDPQQRILLQTVWKTIEDAGYQPADLAGSKTGVFVGVTTADYAELLKNGTVDIEAYTSTGTVFSIFANRISYLLDLHGPSQPIDTACSSSLIAIHRAVEAIRNGSCTMAIAGGVNAMITPTLTIAFSKAGMLSKDGHCKTFDKKADGYVRGEGVGSVLLKPLAQAEADHDHIYAVIRGSAENHGGRATSLTAPNPKAQAELLVNAYEQAGIAPDTVSYLEAHGTGTSLGDPIEINSLKKAFAELYKKSGKTLPDKPHCGIGAVKTNIGHLETAAGMAGLFKVLLAMQHQTLPGMLHFEECNPYIQLENTPFYIHHTTRPWTPLNDHSGLPVPRRAGVSSFGFGGANAHVVLEEYVQPQVDESVPSGAQLLVLSAKDPKRLRVYAQEMAGFLKRTSSAFSLADLAYTLQVSRAGMEERLAMVVTSLDQARELFLSYAESAEDRDAQAGTVYHGNAKMNQADTSLLVEGDAGRAFLEVILKRQELHKLAQLWVKGCTFDWQLLHSGSLPRRISLPTYPFAQERYWVPAATGKTSQYGRGGAENLHPLVQSNTSTLRVQKFTTVLQGNEFYVSDHVLGGNRMLPGVAYLEMARAAGEIAGENRVCRLNNVVWMRPINVPKTTEVEMRFIPEARQLQFEISTRGDEQERLVHVQGGLEYGELVEPAEVFDIAALKNRCQETISPQDFYAILDQWEDADLKTNFQVVQEIYRSSGEALSHIALPLKREHDQHAFFLHPLLMDGAVQTTVLGVFRDIPSVHVPFSVAEVEIFSDLTQCVYAYAVLRTDRNGPIKSFDTYLLDKEGRVLVALRNFSVREFHGSDKPDVDADVQAIRETAYKEPLAHDSDKRQEDSSPRTQDEQFLVLFQADMKQIAAEIVKAEPEHIVLDEDLYQYGFDSISFAAFANQVNDKYSLSVTPTVFFEAPNLEEITRHLYSRHKEILQPYYQKKEKEGSGASVSTPSVPLPTARQINNRFAEVSAGSSAYRTTEPLPIAIIGMSGSFPGAADLDMFWSHLVNGADLVSEVPQDRWDWQTAIPDAMSDPLLQQRIRWGGFMSDVMAFDPLFFGISPYEAELMDPQHRLFLQAVWHAFEHAGYSSSDISGTRTGLFVGVATNDYKERLVQQYLDTEPQSTTGTVHALIANRVSFLLNLHGPSQAIDTACSSALVAVHRAVQAIRHEQCAMAVAGGINVILRPSYALALGKAGEMLSVQGRCKTFDKNADGYVRGEGVGAVLLKSLDQAEADGDTIHAVIRGSAENHGGHAASLTAPNPQAQTQLLVDLYTELATCAGITADTVRYIEAHGTGTKLGDPIEINALKQAFSKLYAAQGLPAPEEPLCGIGTVKTNIGHLETAAGMAGLFKTVLSMQHRLLPGMLHLEEVNPFIELRKSPFYLVTENHLWAPTEDAAGRPIPLRAGVSSFGFGGSNAHLLVEEYKAVRKVRPGGSSQELFLLSAKNPERLLVYLDKFIDFLEQDAVFFHLRDLAYTLQVGRDPMTERFAAVISSPDELLEVLIRYRNGETEARPGVYSEVAGNKEKTREDSLGGERSAVDAADIKALIRSRNLDELARLWIMGKIDRADVPWHLLYPQDQERPQRIPLPTYPFAKDHYRIPVPAAQFGQPDQPHADQYLHPLLDSNESTLDAQAYSKVLHREAFYLSGHRIHDEAVLPAAAYLEMARAGAALARPGMQINALRRVVWAAPVKVTDKPITVQLYLLPDASEKTEEVNFEVCTAEQGQEEQVHAQGKIAYMEQSPETALQTPERIDIEAVRTRCPDVMQREACYAWFAALGLNYGSAFQVIDQLYRNEDEALSCLVLDPSSCSVQNARDTFILHPALLDGALQTVAGITAGTGAALYLPFSLGELHLTQTLSKQGLPHTCQVYATWAGGVPDPDAPIRKYNVQVLDENGAVLVSLSNFCVKKIETHDQAEYRQDPVSEDILRQLAEGALAIEEVQLLLAGHKKITQLKEVYDESAEVNG